MCTYSMISGHYRELYPQPYTFPSQQYPGYQELLRKARLYDEMMNQKDCPDPEKAEWEKQLEKFMRDKYGMEPSA